MVLRLTKIISGGQTGADMGALLAAQDLSVESGGVAPKGWLTEEGPQLFLLPYPDSPNAEDFRNWLERHSIQVLNVAGNRESQSPGIAEFTRSFLILALGASPH